MSITKISRHTDTGTFHTITGGSKAERMDAVLVQVSSPKGMRKLRAILDGSPNMVGAAKIEVTSTYYHDGGGTQVSMFRDDGVSVESYHIGRCGGLR